jgi:signal transduction histidine kinase
MHLSGTILEAIADSMAERILLLSSDCTVLWMNKAARKQALRAAGEPSETGRLCEQFAMQQVVYAPDTCSESCPVGKCVRSGGRSVSAEHTTIDALTNTTRVDEITVSSLAQGRGKSDQFLFIARDLTERIRHEKALQETADKLRALDEMKSDFISIASHELRTPITAIKSAIDIIIKKKAGDVTELQNKFLTMAERNINRLSSLINDF